MAIFEQPQRWRPTASANLVTLVTSVRWGTAIVGFLWSTALSPNFADVMTGIALLAYALYRTFVPLDYAKRGWQSLISILAELTICLTAIVFTGSWDSPYIFVLFTPVIAAGFERGIWHSLRIAATGVVAVGAAALVLEMPSGITPITTWTGELVLLACVASYGRHLRARAEEAAAQNLTQLRRLNQANALLVGLNQLANDLPASFDFTDTTHKAVEDVHVVSGADMTALVLLDRITNTWSLEHVRGAHLDIDVETKLPVAVSPLAKSRETHLVRPLYGGFVESSRAGIYAPLWASSVQVGLLAVETKSPTGLNSTTIVRVGELAEQIAITIDNARWFERLQARGASQERNRIARDLHDRVGQGVAYIAFELERVAASAYDSAVGADLERLRDDTRNIVSELREALYDLRTEVSEQQSLIETIEEFAGRVAERAGISVLFEHDEQHRLGSTEEREVWRIAQEAIVNAERHAGATEIIVNWRLDSRACELTVMDNGRGISSSKAPDRPSYGITGMRERAVIIGASLQVEPRDPRGTLVRLTIGNADRSGIDRDIEGAVDGVEGNTSNDRARAGNVG